MYMYDKKMTNHCPKIDCFWGFQCAFCVDDKNHKYPICEKHQHKWDALNMNTKIKIVTCVSQFNKGGMNRRVLQIFINKIETLNELNNMWLKR